MQKLKGLWIPAEILLNEDLSDKEKIILAIILYLSEESKSCFESNKYIANIVNVTHERVSKIISALKGKGYVSVKLKYKKDSKEIEERQIIPIVENDKDIINNIKNKNNYNNGTLNFKRTKANFEERAYEGFNFDTLYANYSMLKGTS